MGEIRVGTCGWPMRQADYYETFGVIEIQQTFYQPPQVATAQRWRAEAPAGFEFMVKAFQAITHPPNSPTYRRSRLAKEEKMKCGRFRDTKPVRDGWAATRRIAEALGASWVIFQCPASFRPIETHLNNLRRFFRWVDRGDLRFGFEPRGPAWTDELVRELCGELELIHVVDPFERQPVRGTPRYFRLHGGSDYRHRYSDEELDRLHEMCTAKLTYCMFNNMHMAEDAKRFLDRIEAPAR